MLKTSLLFKHLPDKDSVIVVEICSVIVVEVCSVIVVEVCSVIVVEVCIWEIFQWLYM